MVTVEDAEKEIILNDEMLSDLKIVDSMEYSNIYQEDIPQRTITKYVYSQHNQVFNNEEQRARPKRKCVFTLWPDNKHSFVEIYDREGKEVVHRGNSAWGQEVSKSPNKHVDFIRSCHSVDDVIEKYGVMIYSVPKAETYLQLKSQ